MKCVNCGAEIPALFKHAIMNNNCPACGKYLLDEETMALIEDVKGLILEEANVREETASNLAMALIARYDFNMKPGKKANIKPAQPAENIKMANPSNFQQIANTPKSFVPDLPETISPEEREEIYAEAVRKQYNMIENATIVEKEAEIEDIPDQKAPEVEALSAAIFGNDAGVLEQERLMRLAKQKQAMNSGKSKIRRGG